MYLFSSLLKWIGTHFQKQTKENFRNGAFSCTEDGLPLLAIGGDNQVIKILDCYERKLKTV